MDEKQKFVLIIIFGIGGLLLMVGGTAVIMHLAGQSRTGEAGGDGNSWFNGSRYINTDENWAYIDLTFPAEYLDRAWGVDVFGVAHGNSTYIYSRDSRVNASTNGVKLNLEHDQIIPFDCFDIRVSVMNESQTEQVCLDEFEVR